MKKILSLGGALLLLLLSGCNNPFSTAMIVDYTVTLGRFDPSNQTQLFGVPGQNLTVPILVASQNGVNTGTEVVTLVLDTDGDLATTGDTLTLSPQTVTRGTETLVEIAIPGGATVATHFLIATINPGTGDPTNNNQGRIEVVLGASALPNISAEVQNTGIGSTYLVSPGQAIKVPVKITNLANLPIASGTTLSANASYTLNGVAGTVLGSGTLTLASALYPRQFTTLNVDITAPSLDSMVLDGFDPITDTTWLDTVTVEVAALPSELTIANNSDTFTIKKVNPVPELEVSSFNLTSSAAKVGGLIQGEVNLVNNGYANASGYQVEVFIDIDGSNTKTAGDLSVYTFTNPEPVAYDIKSNYNTRTLYIPQGTTWPSTGLTNGDTYDVFAWVTGTMVETDTTNNVSPGTAVDFLTTHVDLEPISLSTTQRTVVNATDGGSVAVTLQVVNNGLDTLTGDFTVQFYGYTNNNLTAGEIDLGTVSFTQDIASKAKGTLNHTVTIPAGSTEAFYTVVAVLDSTGVIVEADEGNNTPTNASSAGVCYVAVSDTASLNAKVVLTYPNAKVSTDNIYTTFYELFGSSWSWEGSGNLYSGYANAVFSVTVTPGTTYGLNVYSYIYTDTYIGLNLIPNYVTSYSHITAPFVSTSEYSNNYSNASAAPLVASDSLLGPGASFQLKGYYTMANGSYLYAYNYYTFNF